MWEILLEETIRVLRDGKSVVWATVVDHSGSTPRGAGSRMVILPDGTITGSVGGGILEGETLKHASSLFQDPGRKVLSFRLGGEDAAASGMICGGDARILVETVSPDALTFLETLKQQLSRPQGVFLVTLVRESENSFSDCHLLWTKTGPLAGGLNLQQETMDHLQADSEAPGPMMLPAGSGKEPLFAEPLQHASRLYIFGGGHISLELAWIAHRIDFQLIVMDDRREYVNSQRFSMASELIVCPFEEALDRMYFGPDDYVVIVTRGHLYDLDVLRKVIMQSPDYIGMIGSKRKRKLIYEQLLQEGVSREKLDRVYAPIGLKIGAETPAEIAVCIVAELIQVRNQNKFGARKSRG